MLMLSCSCRLNLPLVSEEGFDLLDQLKHSSINENFQAETDLHSQSLIVQMDLYLRAPVPLMTVHSGPVCTLMKAVHSLCCNFLSPGCSGALAKHCTTAYPECTVTIFDLPKVAQMSREHFVKEEDQRISFHEGNIKTQI